jgi:signal transduction histidine kinase
MKKVRTSLALNPEPEEHASEGFSLRVKLVLSHLAVALGAILLMVIVVAFSSQYYFVQSQIDQIKSDAVTEALTLKSAYVNNNNSWYINSSSSERNNIGLPPNSLVMNTNGSIISPSTTTNATLLQALNQAIQGQKYNCGQVQVYDGFGNYGGGGGNGITAYYDAEPIVVNNKVVGAVLMYRPSQANGINVSDFLVRVNIVLLVAGLGLALAVIAISLFLTRRLTKPLVSLTRAAEEMTAGNFSQRVEELDSEDEIAQLAATFNAMADKIESDVTELKEQDQVRKDLLANIAHDLLTPLTAIQGYSEAIADDIISERQQRQETAALIAREVQRLRRMVREMQQMTSLEAGRTKLEIAPLSFHDLVEETLAVIAPECENGGIKLASEVPPFAPLVLADSDRVTQVLLNLLDNARRHTPPGGKITVGARIEREWLVAQIRDSGVGIEAKDLPRIFDRFYRADRSRNARSGGSGLGLAIVKAIVQAHGGNIWAESAPGKGTAVYFSLRLAVPALAPMLQPAREDDTKPMKALGKIKTPVK